MSDPTINLLPEPQNSNQSIDPIDQALQEVVAVPVQAPPAPEPQPEYLYAIQKKQQVIGDEDDFKKLLDQVVMKTNKSHTENLTKAIPKKKVPGKSQVPVLTTTKQEQIKRDTIMKNIESHVKNYRLLNNSHVSDSEVIKLRSEFKEKVFRFLMYGIEEIKMLKPEELSPEEMKIAAMTMKDPYALAKILTTEIDVEFCKAINQSNQFVANKKYKSFLKNFTSNLADETNLQLRRKVLTRIMSAKKMVTLDQQQFYPKHIRDKLIEKQNLLLREAAAQQKPTTTMLDEYQQHQQMESEKPAISSTVQEPPKQKYKYLDSSTYSTLKNLLKEEHITKMKNLLVNDLRKDIQERLLASIGMVFEMVQE